MKVTKLIRLICILCAVLLLGGPVSGAFAAEEPASAELLLESAEPAELPAEEPDAETLPGEEPDAETLPGEEPAPAEEPSEALTREEPDAEAEEPAEQPFAEEEDVDPMALRLAMQLDGGTKTYSDFTPRALNDETLHRGIDVSAWQGSINWQKVAAAGVEFVIIRAGYRTSGTGKLYKDSYFDIYMRGAQAAGLKVGVYFFSQAITTAEAVKEADYLLSLVKDYDFELPLVFDFEYVPNGRLDSSLGKRLSTDICLAFCSRVEAAGYESMVYSNPSTLSGSLYPSELGRLWLAHYTKKTTYTTRGYEYWQCTGSGGINGISGDVDLDFWFQPNAKSGLPFTDVKTTDWFYESVKQAYEEKIVSGTSAKKFSPNATATRGQVTAMIHRMNGEPAWTVPAAFEDLTQDYYKNAIFWAAEQSIVSGYSETVFRPDRAITREELVSVLYRMKGSPETSGSLDAFTDAEKVQTWARDAMTWAVENKIISGYPDGTLGPQNNATRAEVCTILMRFAAL